MCDITLFYVKSTNHMFDITYIVQHLEVVSHMYDIAFLYVKFIVLITYELKSTYSTLNQYTFLCCRQKRWGVVGMSSVGRDGS